MADIYKHLIKWKKKTELCYVSLNRIFFIFKFSLFEKGSGFTQMVMHTLCTLSHRITRFNYLWKHRRKVFLPIWRRSENPISNQKSGTILKCTLWCSDAIFIHSVYWSTILQYMKMQISTTDKLYLLQYILLETKLYIYFIYKNNSWNDRFNDNNYLKNSHQTLKFSSLCYDKVQYVFRIIHAILLLTDNC